MDLNLKGMVLNIQRFSIHDGPGIRTLIFLKGCPLKCKWCCNPESQNIYPEMTFQAGKCIACGDCVNACSMQAIPSLDNLEANRELCTNCGDCAGVCPSGARTVVGREMSVSEVINEVRKDLAFYKSGNGGLTLSGGEPFAQPLFAKNLLQAAKSDGMNTAVETCGFYKPDLVEESLKSLDVVYVDLKCVNPTKHKELTGVSNDLILSNIKLFSEYPVSLVIRMVIVPGLNDADQDLDQALQFLNTIEGDFRLELMPYHRLGVGKYRQLGRQYSLEQVVIPDKGKMESIRNFFRSFGINTSIGGK